MQEAGVKECRICKAEEGELVAPCACKGSMKWVHEVCLVSWLKARRQRGARERDACEVCGETVWVRITGTDFLLFPYSAATHDLGDPLLISVLVLAVLTSTTAFLLCTAMETMEVNLWSTVIRWVLTPAIMLLKAGLLHAWLCSAPKKLEHFTSHLMRVFTIIPSLSELLFVSFLNTTRIIFATMTEEGDKDGSLGPFEYRIIVVASAMLNYAAIALLLRRAFTTKNRIQSMPKGAPHRERTAASWGKRLD